jgi:hypothetical protein
MFLPSLPSDSGFSPPGTQIKPRLQSSSQRWRSMNSHQSTATAGPPRSIVTIRVRRKKWGMELCCQNRLMSVVSLSRSFGRGTSCRIRCSEALREAGSRRDFARGRVSPEIVTRHTVRQPGGLHNRSCKGRSRLTPPQRPTIAGQFARRDRIW